MNRIALAIQNKHTTIAAVVLLLAKAIGAQFPKYKPFCDTLFDGAIAYGLFMAPDAKQPTEPPHETPPATLPPAVH